MPLEEEINNEFVRKDMKHFLLGDNLIWCNESENLKKKFQIVSTSVQEIYLDFVSNNTEVGNDMFFYQYAKEFVNCSPDKARIPEFVEVLNDKYTQLNPERFDEHKENIESFSNSIVEKLVMKYLQNMPMADFFEFHRDYIYHCTQSTVNSMTRNWNKKENNLVKDQFEITGNSFRFTGLYNSLNARNFREYKKLEEEIRGMCLDDRNQGTLRSHFTNSNKEKKDYIGILSFYGISYSNP